LRTAKLYITKTVFLASPYCSRVSLGILRWRNILSHKLEVVNGIPLHPMTF